MKLKRKIFASIRGLKKDLWKMSKADTLGKPLPKFSKGLNERSLINLAKKDGRDFERVMNSQVNKAQKMNKKAGFENPLFNDKNLRKSYISQLKENMRNIQ